ncbi:MAG TPA: MerR family transcriptional regulator, partial [Myxococcota bacterium]|nr:MerR family transcriptional regulator [Myxococcota bacterium]
MTEDPLQPWRQQELDLPGLVEAAATLLSRCAAPADERVSARPDERTVRYYQTLGLVDKPARYEGRVARYHFRHLLQVVSIKLLQGHGLGLHQIQGSLAGATDAELEAALLQQLGMAPVLRPAPR